MPQGAAFIVGLAFGGLSFAGLAAMTKLIAVAMEKKFHPETFKWFLFCNMKLLALIVLLGWTWSWDQEAKKVFGMGLVLVYCGAIVWVSDRSTRES